MLDNNDQRVERLGKLDHEPFLRPHAVFGAFAAERHKDRTLAVGEERVVDKIFLKPRARVARVRVVENLRADVYGLRARVSWGGI